MNLYLLARRRKRSTRPLQLWVRWPECVSGRERDDLSPRLHDDCSATAASRPGSLLALGLNIILGATITT